MVRQPSNTRKSDPLPYDPTVILCGCLVDGTGGPPRHNVAVVVHRQKVARVDEIDAVVGDDRYAAAEVVDARDGTLVPGLVDAHVHAAWSYDGTDSGWPAGGPGADGALAWATRSVQAALAAGVTTVRDCGAPGLATVWLRDAVATGVTIGPRVIAAGPCITTTAGHGEFIGVCADTIPELRQQVRKLTRDGVDFIKVMASGGSMDPDTNRRRAQYTAAELAALVDEASRLGRPVVAHANATEAIRRVVEAGVGCVAHCNWLSDTDGYIDYDPRIAAEIVERDVVIDLNLSATMSPLADHDGAPRCWSNGPVPTNRWELHRDLRDAGARILFSSDEFGPGLARFPALLARSVDELEVDICEVIHRATAVAADALDIADVGRVVPGARADLALFDGDLSQDPNGLTRCRAVWRSGELLAVDGRIGVAW